MHVQVIHTTTFAVWVSTLTAQIYFKPLLKDGIKSLKIWWCCNLSILIAYFTACNALCRLIL